MAEESERFTPEKAWIDYSRKVSGNPTMKAPSYDDLLKGQQETSVTPTAPRDESKLTGRDIRILKIVGIVIASICTAVLIYFIAANFLFWNRFDKTMDRNMEVLHNFERQFKAP